MSWQGPQASRKPRDKSGGVQGGEGVCGYQRGAHGLGAATVEREHAESACAHLDVNVGCLEGLDGAPRISCVNAG